MYAISNDKNRPTINSLADISIGGPTNDQVLSYNGTKWINGTIVSALSGKYTPTVTAVNGCTNTGNFNMPWMRVGNMVVCQWRGFFNLPANTSLFNFQVSIPPDLLINKFSTYYQAHGTATSNCNSRTTIWNGFVQSIPDTQNIVCHMRCASLNTSPIADFEIFINFSFSIINY